MQYRYLGNSGLKVSVLSFGNMTSAMETWRGGNDILSSEIEQAHFLYTESCIKAGINLFDTSELYGKGISEIILGRNLKQGGWDRDELVISTKLHPAYGGLQGNSKKRMRIGINQSLQRLQLDNVDLLFLHRIDRDVPLYEQIATINEFIEDDKTFYWGTSEMTPGEISEVFKICEKYGFIKPITEQCQYSMLARKEFEVDLAPIFDQYKFGTMTWSPLAGGLLSGKYNDGIIPSESRFSEFPMIKNIMYHDCLGWRKSNGAEMLQGLNKIAEELGCTQSQLALAWVIYNKDVSSALFGVSKAEQIHDNVKALSIMNKLDKGILDRIEDLLINRPNPPINYRDFALREPRR